jgi:DNA polymerase-3 subunit epsilon
MEREVNLARGKNAVRLGGHRREMFRQRDSVGRASHRAEVQAPVAYAVFDCETTGTAPGVDDVVSLALLRLDADGVEIDRLVCLLCPSRPIPPEATAIHGIGDSDVAGSPRFGEVAARILELLDGAVFVAHNVEFDLAFLQAEFMRGGIDYQPARVACTLAAFRLVEPTAGDHRLGSVCDRQGFPLTGAHDALNDALATAVLLRVLLHCHELAPETVELDHVAFMRLRARGDTRVATAAQIRRVFGMARSAGLNDAEGSVDRERVVALVEEVTGTANLDALTREQVQVVFDELERLLVLDVA